MMIEVTELVKSLQTLVQEATAHYQRLNAGPLPEKAKVAIAPPAAQEAAAPEEKKRGRPKKSATATEVAGAAEAATGPTKGDVLKAMTEDESATEVLETAKQYVQRFQKETPDGMTRAKKIIADRYKATRLAELKHDQRVDLIAILRAEMEAAG